MYVEIFDQERWASFFFRDIKQIFIFLCLDIKICARPPPIEFQHCVVGGGEEQSPVKIPGLDGDQEQEKYLCYCRPERAVAPHQHVEGCITSQIKKHKCSYRQPNQAVQQQLIYRWRWGQGEQQQIGHIPQWG